MPREGIARTSPQGECDGSVPLLASTWPGMSPDQRQYSGRPPATRAEPDIPPADHALAGSSAASTLSAAGSAPLRLIREGHQFHRPSSTTVEGTSSVRTRKVSM